MEPPNRVEELLKKEIPTKLWHYTSVQGFHSIVTSKRIFATDIRFLNDRKEFIHAREVATEIVADAPELGSNFFPLREQLAKAVDLAFGGQLHADHLQMFVASFSASEDQLSQWRGYSHGSSGVSLAFQLSALRPPSGLGILVSFAPCVYKPADKKALLSDVLSHFMKESQGYWDAGFQAFVEYNGARPLANNPTAVAELVRKIEAAADFRSRLASALVKTRGDLLRIAALLKDESFHEENEWRLVLPVSVEKENMQNPPRFRAGNTTLVPYIAYPFPNSTSATLPLVDVILGPGSHPSATQAALAFLKSEGIKILPRESKVPYRPL